MIGLQGLSIKTLLENLWISSVLFVLTVSLY
jgi:hypothetical protein